MMLFAPVVAKLETRAESDGSVSIAGTFPYQTVTTLGTWAGKERREQFAPGAFEFGSVDLLSQHTFDRPLASTDAGSLSLRNTDAGLDFEARIAPDVAGVSYIKDALTLIRSGLARGLSPGFMVDDERIEDDGQSLTRTIVRARLHELSIVTRPAYPKAQVEARSWAPTDGPGAPSGSPRECYPCLMLP